MLANSTPLRLPNYSSFAESIASLALPFSASKLHGIICAYLSAGAIRQGEAYLRALTTHNKDFSGSRHATYALFSLFTVTQQQLRDFEFEVLIPDDDAPLPVRAEAFSEWCDGYTENLLLVDIDPDSFDEDTSEAFYHLRDFGALDYVDVSLNEEEDERAFMEISEYARVTVLQIYSECQLNQKNEVQYETAH